MNLMIICGNLAKDAELKTTGGGTSVAEFSVAVNHGYGDNQKTTWVNCSMFGKRAESLAQYLTKGSRPTLAGTFQLDEWTNQDGVKNKSLKMNVTEVTLGAKLKSHTPPQNTQAAEAQKMAEESYSDQIPF